MDDEILKWIITLGLVIMFVCYFWDDILVKPPVVQWMVEHTPQKNK